MNGNAGQGEDPNQSRGGPPARGKATSSRAGRPCSGRNVFVLHGENRSLESLSMVVCTMLEMVRTESSCRHVKPLPSTRTLPSPFCSCNRPGEFAVCFKVL